MSVRSSRLVDRYNRPIQYQSTYDTDHQTTKSLQFDGSDDYVLCGQEMDYDRTDPFSVSFWLKPTANTNVRGLFGKAAGGAGIVANKWSDNKVRLLMSDGVATIAIFSTSTVSLSTWQHLLFTYDGSGTANGMKFYLDGVENSTVTTTGPLTGTVSNAGIFYLGKDPGAAGIIQGNITELAFYGTNLTGNDVTALAEKPHNLLNLASSQYLDGWISLGNNDHDAYPTLLNEIEGAYHGYMVNMSAASIVADAP